MKKIAIVFRIIALFFALSRVFEMKKITSFILIVLLVIAFDMTLQSMEQEQNIRIRIDGNFIHIPISEQQPLITGDRVMVPVRTVMEAMRFSVEWWESTQTVVLSKFPTYVFIEINSYHMDIGFGDNINTVQIDTPARIINDRTMLPIRAIAEATGFEAEWDEANRIVDITTHVQLRPWQRPVVRPEYWPEHLPYHFPGTVKLLSDESFTSLIGLDLFPMQFRAVFYTIPHEIIELVPSGERREMYVWRDSGVITGETMALLRFVQVHNIPREDFEAVINHLRAIQLDWIEGGIITDSEFYELPNADIIYTFDNEIIRYFFRRE